MLLCPRFIVLIIEHADCHNAQANNNKSLSSTGTTDESSEPNLENPYHVTADEISAIRNVHVCYIISCTLLLMMK